MSTTFTIAIPTHDRRETAVLAARSALAQTRPPEEVLVLCDGCTDGTAAALLALGDPRLQAIELPKAPGYGYEHRNHSLEVARGEAILWLADDDLLAPDHLERIGEIWDTGAFDLVQSHGVIVHPDDRLEWCGADWSVEANRARLATSNPNPMASVSLRVKLARAVGGWDAGLVRAADWDLWQRALATGARSAMSPEPTVLHFRATGRDQAWPLRVRQNTAWLARLEDPRRPLELRILLRRAGAEHEAAIVGDAELLRGQSAALQRDLVATQAQAAGLQTALTRVYTGGWWRLRERLLPLLTLAGRVRRR